MLNALGVFQHGPFRLVRQEPKYCPSDQHAFRDSKASGKWNSFVAAHLSLRKSAASLATAKFFCHAAKGDFLSRPRAESAASCKVAELAQACGLKRRYAVFSHDVHNLLLFSYRLYFRFI